MKKLLVVSSILMLSSQLSGCATVLGAIGLSEQQVEEAALDLIESKTRVAEMKSRYVEWSICKDMRMEQWQQMFGTTATAEAWKAICLKDNTNIEVPLAPTESTDQ